MNKQYLFTGIIHTVIMRLTLSGLVLGLVASATAADRKINRRPDSEWDHIVRGSDLLKTSAGKAAAGTDGSANSNGKPSYLANYQMRARVTDPSELGVDTVKQLSGYLDDNENDKHLFFCKSYIQTFLQT